MCVSRRKIERRMNVYIGWNKCLHHQKKKAVQRGEERVTSTGNDNTVRLTSTVEDNTVRVFFDEEINGNIVAQYIMPNLSFKESNVTEEEEQEVLSCFCTPVL